MNRVNKYAGVYDVHRVDNLVVRTAVVLRVARLLLTRVRETETAAVRRRPESEYFSQLSASGIPFSVESGRLLREDAVSGGWLRLSGCPRDSIV